ncbi:preprotein translocase [Massilia sp. Root133]|uniref:tyrosine-type recombinase/integrase n=1 Tax=unclassified Massilia TaxID=2609279 RepID=UPI0006F5D15D|nr:MULTISPECIES: integrase family protein [unclassified Massilia]KQY00240.1 preprotein translocase [Massilia sp. Root133]KQZ39049.1 preprotein translocase [Massilia sp. Root1485]
MKWDNFTSARIEAFKCAEGRQQSIYWDGKTPGLGLRVTAKGAKSYIFETTLNGKTLRITIGDVRTWSISQAQAKATAYKAQTDSGIDPRKVLAEQVAAEKAAEVARAKAEEAEAAAAIRNAVTLGDIWPEYIADRMTTRTGGWSDHHVRAHKQMMQEGGQPVKRGSKLTQPGPLFSLAGVRLVDLTSDRIERWAKEEAKHRPSSARLAWRLLKACMNWCSEHKTYSSMVAANPTKSARAREALGKPKVRNDVLQREMLAPWFSAVRKISNPVISAYLQCLLLVGPRREELAQLRWADVDFQWSSMKLADKIEDFRMVPLTPYVAHLLARLPRRNEWVFSSTASADGHIAEPRYAHNEALAVAGLPHLTLHGLRRSFATLSEWLETPAGIAAQIQGHAPQGVREQNYIRRPLDLLRMWHEKIEAWMLEQAGIDFTPAPAGLRVVASA